MKKKIYLVLFLSFLFIVIASFVIIHEAFIDIKNKFSKKIYYKTYEQYSLFKNSESLFLESIAKYLAFSNFTINAYLTNNKKEIINAFLPLYKSLTEFHLITEMHFFKAPVINFVAFSRLKLKDINLSNSRKDILWVTTTLRPSIHYYVCTQYPGLRATYPVIHNYKILGSISVGENIINFKRKFDEINMPTTIYLNDKILKDSLASKAYNKYKKYPLYKNFRVIGKIYNINLNKKYVTKNNCVYTIIPIRDLFKRTIGYIVIKRNYTDIINIIKQNAIKKIILEITSYLIIFILFIVLFRYIYKRFEDLKTLLDLIKKREFDKIPTKKIKEKDEFDRCKNNLINLAHDLSLYLNLLTDELQYYSKKAYIDDLTSIYNRNFLEEKAEEITEKVRLSKKPFGLIMFDIDNFKKINDTYGHDVGDLVLSEIASHIKNILRKEDLFIRYGGEEFLIILPNTTFKDTIKIAEKIRKTIQNLKIDIGEKFLHVTISLGVTEFSLKDNSIFDAIKRADEKLYKSKRNGKNQVSY